MQTDRFAKRGAAAVGTVSRKVLVRLTYRAFIRHSATDPGVYSLRTSLWKNVDGKWKMAFHQATMVPPFALADARRT